MLVSVYFCSGRSLEQPKSKQGQVLHSVLLLYVDNMNIQVKMENEGTKKMTREDALRRLEEARRLKREYVKQLEKKMKEDFKKRTGQDATYFEVW